MEALSASLEKPAPTTAVPVTTTPKISVKCKKRLTADEYHGQPCDGPSVSRSNLWTLWKKSPAHMFDAWSGNPNAASHDETEALIFGRCAHLLVTNEERFGKEFIVSEYADFRSKEAQLWKAAQGAAGKTVITHKMADTLTAMANVASKDQRLRRLLKHGEGEMSYLFKDHATGIWLKAKPDWVPSGSGPILDYKTSVDASPEAFDRAALSYGYHVQAALGLNALQAVANDSRIGFVNIIQEKTRPYCIELVSFEPDEIKWGEAILRKSLDRLAKCLERSEWPGYSKGVRALRRPHFMNNDAEAVIAEVFG